MGKKYSRYTLVFEGQYLNGKWTGKSKEYNQKDGKLIFEGEYLDGERNGKGIEYYLNGKVKFIGEFLKGERIKKISKGKKK